MKRKVRESTSYVYYTDEKPLGFRKRDDSEEKEDDKKSKRDRNVSFEICCPFTAEKNKNVFLLIFLL